CTSAKEEFSIAVMSDHPSVSTTGEHTSGLSPFLYFNPRRVADTTQCFSEREAIKGDLKSIEEIWQRI
ncbi:MAG: hypothetical protein K2K97_02550, partial [Muribaculaceae bacterium]|nr:hypothetical protein [Muribaculaceae bacterium]